MIKRFICVVLFVVLIMSNGVCADTQKIEIETGIKILVNGLEFYPKNANGEDAMVFVYDGTTYAPLRALAEAFGLAVGYDEIKNMATVNNSNSPGNITSNIIPQEIIKEKKSINIETGIKILVNNEEYKPKNAAGADAMVFVYEGTTYAPLRSLAETYGLKVGYDDKKMMVTVDEPNEDEHIVYWGQTGTRYHLNKNCSSFKDPPNSGTLEDAKAAGRDGWCQLCSKGETDEHFLKN